MRLKTALAVLLIIALCACTPRENTPLIVIEGKSIPSDELNYILTSTIEQYILFNGYSVDWQGMTEGVPSGQYFREKALESALYARAVEKLAERFKLTLTQKENEEIDQYIKEESEYFSGGQSEFEDYIKSVFYNMDIYRYYYHTIPYLSDKLTNKLFYDGGEYARNEDELRSFYASTYYNVSYIFLSKNDSEGLPLQGTELETLRSVVEALRRQALEGEDFAALAAEHGQDTMSLTPEGIPVPLGQNGEAFDAVLVSLGENEISQIIETPLGFYVIKRLADDPAWFDDNIDMVEYQYVYDATNTLLHEEMDSLTVELSDGWKTLDMEQYAPKG